MKNISLLFVLSILSFHAYANDGAFFGRGNQLIPIIETDISVTKEILTLKKIRNQFIEVTVYYEFFNPIEEKTVTVGFEAFSPSGDVDGAPKNGIHPYMRDFTVQLNEEILAYNVAYVEDSLYAENGNIKSLDLNTFEGVTNGNYVDFYYVYHFDAKFKKGLNKIKHTYSYDVSGGVCYDYSFDYVLTAANRWANQQIDDFTLIIDIGEFESFDIRKTFFEDNSDWLINGIGKMNNSTDFNISTTRFYIQKGNLIFEKKNFKPKGELFVSSQYCTNAYNNPNYLPFSYYSTYRVLESRNELTDFKKKVYRNLPFARRGYVFKNLELKNFFESLDWYIPNPNYVPDQETLSEIEKEWIARFQ